MTESAYCPDRVGAGDAPIWDAEILRARCLGNTGLMTRVIQRFLVTLPTEIAQIATAHAARQSLELARHAHRFRGTTANIGAKRLERLCEAIEQMARQSAWDELAPLATQLTQAEAELALALQPFSSSSPKS